MDKWYGEICINGSYYHNNCKIRELIDNAGFEEVTEWKGQISCCGQSENGCFENIEKSLKKMRVPFDRFSSGYCDVLPCKRIYRPAHDNLATIDVEYYMNYHDEPIIEIKEICKIIDEKISSNEKIIRLKTAINYTAIKAMSIDKCI